MPYPPEHKARTRSRIVESARHLFNRHGFEQVSIDHVMAEAGLTRGGFYHHFRSKDELYAEAVASYAASNPFGVSSLRGETRLDDPRKLARVLVEMYLSDAVFDDVDRHCPLYALSSDVSRAGDGAQQAYTELMHGMTHVFRRALQGRPGADRRAKALVSLCVGGMVLARTTNDPRLRKSLRAAARLQAVALLDE